MLSISSNVSDNQIIEKIESSNYIDQFETQTFSGSMDVIAMASPDNCFETVEQILLNAQTSIIISAYTLGSPYLIEALINRIENGIDVKLLLEKEPYGNYEKNYSRSSMNKLTINLHNGNQGEGRWTNSSERVEGNGDDVYFTYHHCKYAIIDGDILIISSGNWIRTSIPKPQDDGDVDGNRDWWVVIDGSSSIEAQNTVDYFKNVFNYDWSVGYEYNPVRDGIGSTQTYSRYGSDYVPILIKDFSGQMNFIPVISPDYSYTEIRNLIQSAETELLIELIYLTDGLDDLISDVIERSENGVDVKLLLSDSSVTDNATINALIDAGVKVSMIIEEMDGINPVPFIHNKGIIVDNKKVFVGSINWSPTGFFYNREVGIIIESEAVTSYYKDLFDYDWDGAQSLNLGSDENDIGMNNIPFLGLVGIIGIVFLIKKEKKKCC